MFLGDNMIFLRCAGDRQVHGSAAARRSTT
jgi:hypothetical protein